MYRMHLSTKNGVTLIELMIALGLLSVIMIIAGSMFMFGNSSFARGNNQYDIQSDARLASDYIQKQIRYAKTAQLLTTPDDEDGYDYLYFDGSNKLVHKAWNSSTSTHDTKYQSSFELPGSEFSLTNSELTFTVNASLNAHTYDVSSKILLPNLKLAGNVAAAATNAVVKFERPQLMASGGGAGGGAGGGGASPISVANLTLNVPKNSPYTYTPSVTGGSGGYVYTYSGYSSCVVNGNKITWTPPNGANKTITFSLNIKDSDNQSKTFSVKLTTQ